MNTPICDFVARYAASGTLRMHMPGHKGAPLLGCEALDITEIAGADSLYEADGVIRESERNASALFGCETLYSTEGSSQCIRAMLYLVALQARSKGRRPLIAAARNVHRSFLSAAALVDADIEWLYPDCFDSYLSCRISGGALAAALDRMPRQPDAVYITTPDYLGTMAPIPELARVCHERGILLPADAAHGAYLRLLSPSRFAIDEGADLCCSSAHKTLPVLTGGAYLHLSDRVPAALRDRARAALAMFGSTSPSYLILQSLDRANAELESRYPALLRDFLPRAEALRAQLAAHGWTLFGEETLKLCLRTKPFGYTGTEVAELLRRRAIECEFADPDFLVLLLSPYAGEDSLHRVEEALLAIPQRTPISAPAPRPVPGEQRLSAREAAFLPCETLPAAQCEGRILAEAGVSCPPAVPIAVCGERIGRAAIEAFTYYGIHELNVITRD